MSRVRDEVICRIEVDGHPVVELRPGATLRIGRHSDNDLVLDTCLVSRFHCRVTWDMRFALPVLFDCGSQNGTEVNGEKVRTAVTLDGCSVVEIGPVLLRIEIVGSDSNPALLTDTSELVCLFSDSGEGVRGKLGSSRAGGVRSLMEQLEGERRTGTLKLTSTGDDACIVFCLGRIMAAEVPGHGSQTRALERILRIKDAEFEFGPDLEPLEEGMNLWLTDYLGARENPGSTTTRRPEPGA